MNHFRRRVDIYMDGPLSVVAARRGEACSSRCIAYLSPPSSWLVYCCMNSLLYPYLLVRSACAVLVPLHAAAKALVGAAGGADQPHLPLVQVHTLACREGGREEGCGLE